MNRYEKVQTLCKQRGISIRKMEMDLGFSNGYVSKMRNSKPNAEAVSKIAKYFQIPSEALEDDANLSRNEKFIYKDYFGEKPLYRASAGQGAYNDIYTNETIAVDDDYERAVVIGDSMLPELRDGDIAIIQPQTETTSHDYTLVKVDGEHATIKFVEIVSDGVWLRALNKEVFEDKFYTIQDVMTLPVTIIGKVIGIQRSFR